MVGIKPYACGVGKHGLIDAVLALWTICCYACFATLSVRIGSLQWGRTK